MKLRRRPATWVGVKAVLLLGAVLTVALLTPHLVRGHFPLSDSLSQSVVLFFDFLLAFVFFGIYYRDMDRLRKAAVATESRLSDSFRYIGKANVTIELFSEFIKVPLLGLGKTTDKQVVQGLLRKILVTVLKSRCGVLRVVDRTTLRSITEFHILASGGRDTVNLPNSILRHDDKSEILHMGEYSILRSVLPHHHVACILFFRSTNSGDGRLALVLLNQLHLLILLTTTTSAPFPGNLRTPS